MRSQFTKSNYHMLFDDVFFSYLCIRYRGLHVGVTVG